MTEEDAKNFIHSVSWRGSVPGLGRTRELLEKLGNPQDGLKFIHLAGTNGKGSTAAMLSSIMTGAGYRTGLFISPYVTRFNERMQINGAPISGAGLAEMTERVRPAASAMEDPPTEFELVTAIALLWFAASGCDIVVLETGLGGRLDSTNVIGPPECAVLTNIGLDHLAELGGTLEDITREKAGIIKPGAEVVLYEQKEPVTGIVRAVCADLGAKLRVADFKAITRGESGLDGQTFGYKGRTGLFIPLLGEHQKKNAAVALETVAALSGRGWAISEGAVSAGLRETVWPARFEIISRMPPFVVDGGHNPQCAGALVSCLEEYFPQTPRTLMAGFLSDKDYSRFLDILNPAVTGYVAVAPPSSRALPAAELEIFLRRYGKPVTVCGSIEEGVRAASAAAEENGGMALCAGSLYLAGPVRACFGL